MPVSYTHLDVYKRQASATAHIGDGEAGRLVRQEPGECQRVHHVVQIEIVNVSSGDDVDACVPLSVERIESGQLLSGSW